MEHKLICRDVPCDCPGDRHCQFCDGGLSFCVVCRGGECQLPSECVGRVMTPRERDLVCSEKLDFKNGKWIGEMPIKSLEDLIEEATARNLRLNNLFQKQDDKWQANFRSAGEPNQAFYEFGEGPTPHEAVKRAMIAMEKHEGKKTPVEKVNERFPISEEEGFLDFAVGSFKKLELSNAICGLIVALDIETNFIRHGFDDDIPF